ncbi:LamG domain-containing protein, partial [Candidatus Bathyarchaeota archaeon]|nr:LamG domain-containing protein [Candidatus Bathyarchaeota archaeon]
MPDKRQVNGSVFQMPARRVLMILAVILIPISLNLIVVGESQSPSPGESALYVGVSDASEYGYASRTIQSILVNNSVIEFKARAKILRFQSSPVGISLQIDFYGRSEGSQNEQLRFSFRFGNDGSVIFYYPFMNSSAAVTVRRAWGAGEWVSVSTVVSGNSSRFYLNGELMMQNDR